MAEPISTAATAPGNVIALADRETRCLDLELATAWNNLQHILHDTGSPQLKHTPQGWRVYFAGLRVDKGTEIMAVKRRGLESQGLARRYTDIAIVAELRPDMLDAARADAAAGRPVAPDHISLYGVLVQPYIIRPGSRQRANDPSCHLPRRQYVYRHAAATHPLLAPAEMKSRLNATRTLLLLLGSAEPIPAVTDIASRHGRQQIGGATLQLVRDDQQPQ